MRVKLLVVTAALLMMVAPVTMAGTVRAHKAATVSASNASSLPDGLPRIAFNQQRPHRRTLDDTGVVPPDQLNDPSGGDGGGYTEGGCNCSRICYENHSGCNLSVASNGCLAAWAPASCKSCSNNCW